MQTLAKTPRQQEANIDRGSSAKVGVSRGPANSHPLLLLQKSAGNAAVGHLLRQAIAELRMRSTVELEDDRSHSTRNDETSKSDGPTASSPTEESPASAPPEPESSPEAGVSEPVASEPTSDSPVTQVETPGPSLGSTLETQVSDDSFVGLTRSSASMIATNISHLGTDVRNDFQVVRQSTREKSPRLRAKLPGDPSVTAVKPKRKKKAPLPSSDAIKVPASTTGTDLPENETKVPTQPGGNEVNVRAGDAPKIRLEADADPAHLAASADQSKAIGQQIRDQVSSEIAEVAQAASIRRIGVERDEEIVVSESSVSPTATASQEMLEYINTDVPSSVRDLADADFAPQLELSLAGPREQVLQAQKKRDTDHDNAISEALASTEGATRQASEDQEKAVAAGYADIAAERDKGLQEGQQAIADFEADVQQRHAANDEQIRTKVRTEQEKANEAIRKGEEDAAAAEKKAQEEKRAEEEKANRNKPEKKKNWLGQVVSWFKKAIKEWTEKLVNAVKKVFEVAKKVVTEVLTAAKNAAVSIIRGVKEFVVSAIRTFAEGLKVLVDGLLVAFPELRERVNAAIDGIVEATVAIVETVATKLEEAVTAVVDKVQSIVNRVLDFCEAVIVTQIQIIGALLTGDFKNAAMILFLAACKAFGIPGEEFLDILADAGDALLDIVKRPAKFLGYLLKSVGDGMKSFFSNFPQRMVSGLTGWLFGQVAEGGFTLPKSFDLKSIFILLIQVMGFTFEYVKAKVIQLLGEKTVGIIEQVLTPIRILFTEGPGALWHWLADQADQVKKAIIEAASQWLITQIITQAAIKLATMFTPVGAFVQAVLMMYNTIMFFVEKIKEIFAWVKSITSSLKTIAVGAISAAADYIDQAMSKSIPLIIAFLAKLVGIGGIGEKIRQVVSKLRTPVDKAITFVVENLIKLAKAAWGGVKKGAAAVKDAVEGWWEAKEPFTDKSGNAHTLFIQQDGDRHSVMVASAVQKYDKLLTKIESQYRKSPDAEKRETYERAKVAFELLTRRIARLEKRGGTEKDQAELPELKELAIRSQALMVETDGELTSVLEWVHLALDGAGMVPALGVFPDAVNTGLYLIEGDWLNAGISAAAMIPILGQGATATKHGVRVSKEALEKVGKERLERELLNTKSLAGKKAATTPLGRSIESLKDSIRTNDGTWKRHSAHADKAVSQHPNAKATKSTWDDATNIEEVYVNTETREMLVRHRIVKGGETIKESYRPFSKFGVDPPYPPKPQKAYYPEPEIVRKQTGKSLENTVEVSKSVDNSSLMGHKKSSTITTTQESHAPSSVPGIRIGKWGKGSFGSAADSLKVHFEKHGAEVGAKDIDQYLRKAEAFAQNLRGATKSEVDGATHGVTRYKKLDKYIDIDRDANIISFGLQ